MITDSHVHLDDFCDTSIFIGRTIGIIASDRKQQLSSIDEVFFYEFPTYTRSRTSWVN